MQEFVVSGIAMVRVRANNQGEAKHIAERVFEGDKFNAIEAFEAGDVRDGPEAFERDVGSSGQDRAGAN